MFKDTDAYLARLTAIFRNIQKLVQSLHMQKRCIFGSLLQLHPDPYSEPSHIYKIGKPYVRLCNIFNIQHFTFRKNLVSSFIERNLIFF